MEARRVPWKRREFTTKGSDPTVVVIWSKGDITITEFQNIVQTRTWDVIADEGGVVDYMGKELFQLLEDQYQEQVIGDMNG
jgi:hypothetical protein